MAQNGSPNQSQLFPSLEDELRASRGVVFLEEVSAVGIDPEARCNIATLACAIGARLMEAEVGFDSTFRAPRPHESFYFDASQPANLNHGLYIPTTDARRRNIIRPSQMAVVTQANPNIRPGSRLKRPFDGLVVTSEEYGLLVQSAQAYAGKIDAQVRGPHFKDENQAETDNSVAEKVIDAMRTKIEAHEAYTPTLQAHRRSAKRINRDARLSWRTAFKAGNLNRERQRTDALIHRTAELACLNLDYNPAMKHRIHRQIFKQLYPLNHNLGAATVAWTKYTHWLGVYIDDVTDMFDRSQLGCQKQKDAHAKLVLEPGLA